MSQNLRYATVILQCLFNSKRYWTQTWKETRMAFSRAHTSAKAADVAKFLLSNNCWLTLPSMQSTWVPPPNPDVLWHGLASKNLMFSCMAHVPPLRKPNFESIGRVAFGWSCELMPMKANLGGGNEMKPIKIQVPVPDDLKNSRLFKAFSFNNSRPSSRSF